MLDRREVGLTMGVRRRRDQRGAVAVEAALVTPVLMLMLFGIVEMSLLMRDVVSISSSVRAGSRVASAAAAGGPCNTTCTPNTAPVVGQAAASAIERAGATLPDDALKWMMVYQDNGNGFPLGQTDVTTASGAPACGANCVVYTWDPTTNKFKYSSGTWNTTTQVNACVNDAGRHSVGIAVRIRHSWVTGLFGSGVDLTERSVMQFEPLPNETCLPGQHN
ncbi:MAG: pilus assembly protein [Marmoricola sp.]|jgi:Flp pilus assembly protein TadG|nr:pilus assembly protein [Marmoricola sp.]